jgi:hypothetical protein
MASYKFCVTREEKNNAIFIYTKYRIGSNLVFGRQTSRKTSHRLP